MDRQASGSLDHSARLWDVAAGRCKQALRGHVDSVNEVCWMPYSNILATGSSDKTVSLWDARTSLCAQTFYGHMNRHVTAAAATLLEPELLLTPPFQLQPRHLQRAWLSAGVLRCGRLRQGVGRPGRRRAIVGQCWPSPGAHPG